MLKHRILTALALLPLMLGMLFFAGSGLWVAFGGLISLLALREYARIAGLHACQNRYYLFASALLGGLLYASGGADLDTGGGFAVLWMGVLAFWLVVAPVWLYAKWELRPGWSALLLGWVLFVPFWLAFVGLRPDAAYATDLLAVMVLVWLADVAAYGVGRVWGRRRLAPVISPKKSWEGALGAMACAVLYALWLHSTDGFTFGSTWLSAVGMAVLLTIVSIYGDLLESWFKRAAGIKDSGRLLPGHGGVWDRIDSLVAVLSVYAALTVCGV